MTRPHRIRSCTTLTPPARTGPLLRALLAWLLAGWIACLAMPSAQAQALLGAAPVATDQDGKDGPPLPQVDDLRKQLDAIPQKLDTFEDTRAMLTDMNAIGVAAGRVVTRRTADLVELDRRLEGLGPTPDKGAPADAPDVAAQRAALSKQRAAIDAELKLARLIAVDAEQRGADLMRQRRAQFQAALTMRTDSPLGPTFWRILRQAAPGDYVHLKALGAELQVAVNAALDSPRRNAFLGALALALLLALGGTWLSERILVRVLPARLPSGRLRRTLLATTAIAANVLIVSTAVQLVWNGLRLGGALGEDLLALRQASLRTAAFAAFVVTLGHGLLARRRSSWRLLPISDALARRLSPFPWWIAALSALGGLVTDIGVIVGV
ncbi:MAG TPA: DUF3772 domain-containing protein, partial [Alicycliphilus sp.]|nr:DUF3772 domain-containing protein [Alicycliphilus sp.]